MAVRLRSKARDQGVLLDSFSALARGRWVFCRAAGDTKDQFDSQAAEAAEMPTVAESDARQ